MKNVLHAKNEVIPASEARHDIANMFLLTNLLYNFDFLACKRLLLRSQSHQILRV